LGLLPFFLSPEMRGRLIHAMLGLPSLAPIQDRQVQRALGETIGFALAAGGLMRLSRGGPTGILFLTAAELCFVGSNLHPTTPSNYFHDPVLLAREFQGERHRLALTPAVLEKRLMSGETLEEGYQSLRRVGYPVVTLPYRVLVPWSYEVFGLRDFAAFRRLLNRENPGGGPLDFLAVSGLVSHVPMSAPRVLAARAPNALYYRNPSGLERLTWVNRARVEAGEIDRLNYLKNLWDPKREVVLEMDPGTPSLASIQESLSWGERPGKISAQGNGPAGWLVNSGVDFPGWRAFVNGRAVKIWRANHAFQALPTPKGEWRAWLVYRPALFKTGLGLGVAALLGLAAWGLARARYFGGVTETLRRTR